tara:strand:+ start:8143 stop:13506 length:5364 start_codon:yes stop_codon:yes gene_type:complete
MPLNKLDNFIKNTEGRILYVSPSDLDSSDSIDNQGNSLARPFKTLQRALIESARFSYIKGRSNDSVEKTTVLLMPGEHTIDNRPGFQCFDSSGVAKVKSPGGVESNANITLDLNLNTNFDLTQEDNILYKFNSTNGGVIVPRGTSVVGLDLRKTKIRPLYVPNPTDINVPTSSIFRITGTCYFWQFSIFDGNENSLVYTNNTDFGDTKKSIPTFSHNKLTVFEYADGVNNVSTYGITDLDMYYAKLSNAYNTASTREIEQSEKYPQDALAFEKQRPEYEIVGAFAADPLELTSIEAGSGGVVTSVVTVRTKIAHGFQVGTPIKIRGVIPTNYNISAIVTSINLSNDKEFTYSLQSFPLDLKVGNVASATATIETDTVFGASPYIFNISMRSVYGLNGLHADGDKATGFRSMVVAQFTGVSLQKDDRAFVEYDSSTRSYNKIAVGSAVYGSDLSSGSSATATGQVYHLNSGAIYRDGWETCHIKMSNDAVLQIVSVFAIGYAKHFAAESGADASITNSNSNFGQLALISDGFKREAFAKDDKGFITSVIPPRAIDTEEEELDWVSIAATNDVASTSTKLYLHGYKSKDVEPLVITQGYRVGAKVNDKIYLPNNTNTPYEASIVMEDGSSSFKSYTVTDEPDENSNSFFIASNNLVTGEKVIIVSDDGDLPENLETNKVYYIIKEGATRVKLASSEANANNSSEISVSFGTNLKIITRVSDKSAGEVGHPVQYDDANNNWFINVASSGNTITSNLTTSESEITFIKRTEDTRGLDEKLYKLRIVIPKETVNGKPPENGFIIQESSSTGFELDSDATKNDTLTTKNYRFDRNPRFISTCSYSNPTITVVSEIPHGLNTDDLVIVKNVTDTTNTTGAINAGYNGTFKVTGVTDDMTFTYGKTDVNGIERSPSAFLTNDDRTTRSTSSPRFEKNDLQTNYYIYRKEVISDYEQDITDGIYHVYALSADKKLPIEFDNLEYSQNVVNLYPQLDRDNVNDNPQSTKSFAARSPLGKVDTDDLKKSLTRESLDDYTKSSNIGKLVSTNGTGADPTITFSRRHGLSGIATGSINDASSGANGSSAGVINNVKLLTTNPLESSGGVWQGATGDATFNASGELTNFKIVSKGSAHTNDQLLYLDNSVVGAGGGGAQFRVGISDGVGTVLQFTGIGTASDSYHRVTSVSSDTQVVIAKTASDPDILSGQYAIEIGPVISVSSASQNGADTTFNTTEAHGLVVGNKFRILTVDNVNVGDFVVKSVVDVDTFTATTTYVASALLVSSTAPKYILKHGYSSNAGSSDASDENLGSRSLTFYDNEYAYVDSSTKVEVGDSTVKIDLPGSLTNIEDRFSYGSYIEIDDEIMRVASPTVTNDKITVIRGALATGISSHDASSLIRRIKPLPVEFRRQSILRASGHTFEYLGYGPGNYSTALPQVQDRTLTANEEYLAQSQEKAAGAVVYTGMNSKGDFYIGNTKKSALTGEEINFDIPVPTITGENPSNLSVVFDEVTIKERIVVEGGDSGQVLSQFDGPVTFNNSIKVIDLLVGNKIKLAKDTASISFTTGSLVIEGGVGIAKSVFVGQGLHASSLNVTGDISGADVTCSDINAVGVVTATGGTFGNIGIGTDDNQTVTTSSGKLILDAATNEVEINADLDHNGDLDTSGSGTFGSTGTFGGNLSVTGTGTFTGDITALTSDIRLKDDISPITEALEKVKSISGFTYKHNELAKTACNLDTGDQRFAGVSAQEIQAILPEAVKPAPSNNEYLTVQYEKLVPLLIESVKELSAKVDNLEQKLSDK